MGVYESSAMLKQAAKDLDIVWEQTSNVWKDAKPILYNLPDVGRAKEVIIVEGEKAADTVAGMGLVATTCPMGAGKWREEYNDTLRGKDVVLIPDNDNEGRQHMAKVGASLKGIAKSIKWIDLDGLPSKGDISDWVTKYGDITEAGERLAIMIDGAGRYEPRIKKTIEDVILTTQDFSAIQLKEKREFLDPWLKENSINLISGWRGCGKTWEALSILETVADEGAFGPWKCKSSVPCLFLDGEMPQEDIQERIKGLRLDRPMKNPLYIYSDAQANQYGLPRAHLAKESWRTKMKSLLLARHVKLWVVDNLASLASGLDENSRKDWDPINQWLLELRFAGIATIMLHHTNKDGGQRGTSAREDNLDISMVLKIPRDYSPEDGARFIVHFTKARVSNTKLQAISDTEFKLIQDEAKNYVWTYTGVKQARKTEILRMLNEGLDPSAIAEALDISRAYISKTKSQAIRDGILSKNGKFTQAGFMAV